MKKQDFREKLIEVRKARGLTQEDVAKKCKVTVRTIQRLESGQVTPRAYTIRTISENLGISYFETSNNDVKNKEQQSNRKTQTFYWYARDLFNLKTSAMKKVSILTTPFLLSGFVLFFFPNSETNAQTNDYSSSLNNYSFDLYHDIKVEKENLIISPLSTYYALLAAYEGSKNKTKQEFEKILYLNNSGSLNNNYLHYFATKSDSFPGVNVANAIWLDKNLVLEGDYSKSVSDKYFSDFERTEFANTEKAVSDINGWVSNKTSGKIDEIINDSHINADTKLVISNAVYFRREWLFKFDKQKTVSAPFFTSVENQYKVDFMNMTESLKYFENEEYQFISKPYRNSDLSFGIILPKKLFGIEEIEEKMSNEFFNQILDSTSYIKTALSIPKLKLESNYELSDALKGVGLKTAFTSEADFSGITKEEPVQFSKVLHKAGIELDEEKTEAAAATAASVKITGRQSYKIFKADHPFVFFVLDNKTKIILFMGRYVKPVNGEEIEKEIVAHNLEKRKQEKLEVGNAGDGVLLVVNNKIVSSSDFQAINQDDIESVHVYKDKKEVAKYSSKNYEGVVVITLKKELQDN
ncbi:helix-turn-helix domain-containing protein [Salinimicrobium sp. MT39]|uniref:Helix-turn-helix domain-containing protein n=1 Tax=Salinimicrobium profundisediminis TaxID=2994553 RepID=A0A9X3I2U5_9FLAO|nr:serpin family protein [Salinimicrobium profundisediminis]MCX2839843.1 helix-turn-helix domain-containing protein [Salinimicrobium profundisediminis]